MSADLTIILKKARERWNQHMSQDHGSLYICDSIQSAASIRGWELEVGEPAWYLKDEVSKVTQFINDQIGGSFSVLEYLGVCRDMHWHCREHQLDERVVSFRLNLWDEIFTAFEVDE